MQREDKETQQGFLLFYRVQSKDSGCDRVSKETEVASFTSTWPRTLPELQILH